MREPGLFCKADRGVQRMQVERNQIVSRVYGLFLQTHRDCMKLQVC
jgi:hypothetical protein